MLFKKMEARKIDKIVASFYNQFCSIEPELIFFYKMNSKQRIFIQCSKCEKNQGVYSIRAQKSWMNEFIQHNGDLKKFHILSSYYLLKIVKSIHGVAIAENAYESNFVVNVIESNDEFIVESPRVPWVPWGTEYVQPLSTVF